MQYLTRPRAAEHLTSCGAETTAQGLADRASKGTGPRYSIINGRALYTKADLDTWLAEQAARPVVRRDRSSNTEQPAP
jgi:hypothetical protein